MPRKRMVGMLLAAGMALGALSTLGLMRWWQAPPVPKTPEQRNRTQLVALAKHRDLYEAFANGNQSLEPQVRATGVVVQKVGGSWRFEWPIPAGEMAALFGCNPVLYFCPNGETDLPPNFWEASRRHSAPLRIDHRWVAVQENCG